MATADHREAVRRTEEARGGQCGNRLFAGVDEVGVRFALVREGPDPEHAIFRLQDNLDIGRHEIGDERRDSYPEIDIKAVFQFECGAGRSEEHTSELQSLMRISYAVFCLKKKKNTKSRQ